MANVEKINHRKQLLGSARDLTTLNDEQLDELALAAREFQLPRGGFLWRLNEPVNEIFLLVDGFLHVQMMGAQGELIITGLVPPQTIVGEVEILGGESRYVNQMVAEKPSHLLAMPRGVFDALLKENIDFSNYWLRLANWKLLAKLQQLHSFGIGSPRTRVARTLLQLTQWQQLTGMMERIPISQQTLGYHTGLSRQVVSGVIKELKQKNIVSLGYGWLRIEIPEALHAIAEEHRLM